VVLLGCPTGHTLRSAAAAGSADLQECQPCMPSQYILNPNTDSCQACPPGLKCDSTDKVTPVVANSTWVRNGSVYRLTGCPAGYSVSSAGVSGRFDASVQQCSPCLKGEECVTVPCVACTPCQPGFYKAAISSENCVACLSDSYSYSFGGQDISSCIRCPKFSGTISKFGRNDFGACICAEGYYMDPVSPEGSKTCLTCPSGAICLNGNPPVFTTPVQVLLSLDGVTEFDLCCDASKASAIINALAISLDVDMTAVSFPASICQDQNEKGCLPNSRRRLLFSSLSIKFTIVSELGSDLASIIQSPNFVQGFASLTNLSVSVSSVLPLSNPDSSSGRKYGPMDPSGQYRLVGCAPGFLLVNDSISTQTCLECLPGTYSMDFMDGCRGLSTCSSGRSCNKCPLGASCSGKNDFTPALKTSVWSGVFDPNLLATVMKLMSCPEGKCSLLAFRFSR
jgi:hypothetical protein